MYLYVSEDNALNMDYLHNAWIIYKAIHKLKTVCQI